MTTELITMFEHLERRNMKGYFVKNKEELHKLIAELIPQNSTVGCGDSVTLEETGLYTFLRSGDYIFNDKYAPGLTSSDKRRLYRKNFSANTFITGSNAITMDGQIVNIDGNGSRVAPMLYGPDQVLIVIGTNKICKDLDAAMLRTRQIAAPLDAKRLGKQTPCATLGRCVDCRHKERICNDFVIIAGQFVKDRIKVIVVEEQLGY